MPALPPRTSIPAASAAQWTRGVKFHALPLVRRTGILQMGRNVLNARFRELPGKERKKRINVKENTRMPHHVEPHFNEAVDTGAKRGRGVVQWAGDEHPVGYIGANVTGLTFKHPPPLTLLLPPPLPACVASDRAGKEGARDWQAQGCGPEGGVCQVAVLVDVLLSL